MFNRLNNQDRGANNSTCHASARCTVHDLGKYVPVPVPVQTNQATRNRPHSAYGGVAQPARNIKSITM